MLETRRIAIETAERLLFKPYLWAGDDPMAGFDCSGFVIEVLKSVGILQREGDWSAAQLAGMFPETDVPEPGCLLFWNRGSTIGHVEMVYFPRPLLTIGASGGGSATTSLQEAVKSNAYIKIRPPVSGWVKMVDPFK